MFEEKPFGNLPGGFFVFMEVFYTQPKESGLI